jgi:hypothetical protein
MNVPWRIFQPRRLILSLVGCRGVLASELGSLSPKRVESLGVGKRLGLPEFRTIPECARKEAVCPDLLLNMREESLEV